jgi:hypothetical protein
LAAGHTIGQMNRGTRDQIDEHWQVSPREADGSRGRGDDSRTPGGMYLGPVRITPMLVVLVVALVGSLAYVAFALTVRDTTQIPMLVSGAVVLGVVFIALAVAGAVRTYQAGVDGHGGRAFGLAIGGGIAAVIGFVCFALAIIGALVYQR